MVLIYSQLTDATALLIGGAIMGMFVNGMLGGYGALLSELYPTEARATAENVLFNLGAASAASAARGRRAGGELFVHGRHRAAGHDLSDRHRGDAALIPEKKGQPLE